MGDIIRILEQYERFFLSGSPLTELKKYCTYIIMRRPDREM